MAKKEAIERETFSAEELLRELAELRDLDERRHAHAPGTRAHDAATAEVDARRRSLMDRLRDGTWRSPRPDGEPPSNEPPSNEPPST